MVVRCEWATGDLASYHDQEWGVPEHDDRKLFELLTLEAAQAGLSWQLVLRRRDAYREVFANFDIPTVASYGEAEVQKLREDPRIIRNVLKLRSTVNNARAIQDVREEFGSFDAYVWSFVNGKPVKNATRSAEDRPSRTPQSDGMSDDLKKRDFKFVGSTMCYAFMQAAGLVNDHEVTCFRYAEVEKS